MGYSPPKTPLEKKISKILKKFGLFYAHNQAVQELESLFNQENQK